MIRCNFCGQEWEKNELCKWNNLKEGIIEYICPLCWSVLFKEMIEDDRVMGIDRIR